MTSVIRFNVCFPVSAVDAIYYEDDGGVADPGSMPSTAVKRPARNRGIDMCLCCARKQLSFCCHACIQRHVSVVSANVLDNRDLSLTDRMLSYKLSSLRMSACSCCAQTSNPYSRCCLWCGTMEHL